MISRRLTSSPPLVCVCVCVPSRPVRLQVCVTSLEGERSGLRGGSKANLSSEGSLPKGPVPQGAAGAGGPRRLGRALQGGAWEVPGTRTEQGTGK